VEAGGGGGGGRKKHLLSDISKQLGHAGGEGLKLSRAVPGSNRSRSDHTLELLGSESEEEQSRGKKGRLYADVRRTGGVKTGEKGVTGN